MPGFDDEGCRCGHSDGDCPARSVRGLTIEEARARAELIWAAQATRLAGAGGPPPAVQAFADRPLARALGPDACVRRSRSQRGSRPPDMGGVAAGPAGGVA